MARLTMNFIRKIFPLLAILLLVPWPVAYAYNFDNEMAGQGRVPVRIAEASAGPSWTAFGKVIGGAMPGDLFYIDATDSNADIQVNLYITNAQELIHCYRYLILNVGVYVEDDAGEWQKASMGNGELVPDTIITMRDAEAGFTLPGLAKYKITIDSGSFYCRTTNTDSGSLSPQFYLEVG